MTFPTFNFSGNVNVLDEHNKPKVCMGLGVSTPEINPLAPLPFTDVATNFALYRQPMKAIPKEMLNRLMRKAFDPGMPALSEEEVYQLLARMDLRSNLQNFSQFEIWPTNAIF